MLKSRMERVIAQAGLIAAALFSNGFPHEALAALPAPALPAATATISDGGHPGDTPRSERLRGETETKAGATAGDRRAPSTAPLEASVRSATASASAETAESSPHAGAQALSISGYVHLAYQRLDRSSDQLADGTGEPLNENRFLVRRARLRADGDWRWLGFAAMLDLSTVRGAQVGLRQLEGILKVPGKDDATPLIRLGAGLFRVPFGYDVGILGDAERLFADRALMFSAFIPGEYDVGVGLSGALRWVRWSIAVQNGEPIGERAFPANDPNSAKDIAGRIGVDTPITPLVRVSGGISGLTGTGFHAGTVPTKDTFVWRDFNEDGVVTPSELQSVRGAAASPSENFDRWGIGLDLEVRAMLPFAWLGELHTYGEAVLAANLDRRIAPADPVFSGRDQRGRGFYWALTQEIGEYLMAGARLDLYEPNADAFDLQGGETVVVRRTFTTWTFALGGRLRLPAGASGRAILDYEAQKNSLGRDSGGRPTKLDNDTLRLRLELAF